MSNTRGPGGETNQSTIYQIRVKDHLDRQWMGRFEEFSITLEEDGTTLLTGPVVDQAALHGILRKIRDLGITLLSINSVGAVPKTPSEIISGDQQAGRTIHPEKSKKAGNP